MSRDRYRLHDYLAHIMQAIDRIERYTAGMDESTFLSNELTQDAVIRNFEIIGEASRNIMRQYSDFVTDHPLLPLTAAYGMRNVLARGYAEVDIGIVWVAIQRDLPALKQRLAELSS